MIPELAPAFRSLPHEEAHPLELSTGARTLFYGRMGANIVWGFEPPRGTPGVAIVDKGGNQVVVNYHNLNELAAMMKHLCRPPEPEL